MFVLLFGAAYEDAQAGLRLCCSQSPEHRFLASRPICLLVLN